MQLSINEVDIFYNNLENKPKYRFKVRKNEDNIFEKE